MTTPQNNKQSSINDEKINYNVYETDELLNMYLGLHFPTSGTEEGIPPILSHINSPVHGLRFPQRVAQLLTYLNPVQTNNRALDIGCAVGGSSFELAKTFDHVEAFDYSESFINISKKMQSGEDIKFNIPIEGDIFKEVKAVHEPGISEEIRQKIHFFAGDACKLSEYAKDDKMSFGTFDGIVMSNLLCRLPDPVACLDGLNLVLNRGGVLVMVTPFSWLEQYTPRSNWVGGVYDSDTGKEKLSQDCLKELMTERGFEKIYEEEMPLVIREHQRKYQYIISQASAWRKK